MPFCQLRQFRISSAIDDGRELSSSLRLHVDSCHACQQFLVKYRVLEDKLKAATLPDESPAWLHTRIMATLNSNEPAESKSHRWVPAAAGVAAIGIVLAVVTLNVREPTDDPQPAAAQLPAPTTPVHPASVTNSLEQHAKRALGNEFRNIATDISDARNFLSASLRSTIPGILEDE